MISVADFSLQGMLDWSVEWCQKQNVGYSQKYRNMQLKDGYITCFDCTSFIFFAVWLGGGYDVGKLGFNTNLQNYINGTGGWAWALTTMRRCLPYIGFNKVLPKPQYCLPGDILARLETPSVSGHAEIVYKSPCQTMGAHSSSYALPDQVSINTGQSSTAGYDEVWRFATDSPVIPPEPVPVGPDPGSPGLREKRKLPIWMMCKPWWKM